MTTIRCLCTTEYLIPDAWDLFLCSVCGRRVNLQEVKILSLVDSSEETHEKG
jgi:hypothetical protein